VRRGGFRIRTGRASASLADPGALHPETTHPAVCPGRASARHPRPSGRSLSECRLGLGIGFRMPRTDRKPVKTKCGRLPAQGAFVHHHTETRLDLALHLDATPAHHPVRRKVRTLAGDLRQLGLLPVAQPWRRLGRAAAGPPRQRPSLLQRWTRSRSIGRSIPQVLAAVFRSKPSKTDASGSIRRATFASSVSGIAARRARTGKSVPVIATAIAPFASMAGNHRDGPKASPRESRTGAVGIRARPSGALAAA